MNDLPLDMVEELKLRRWARLNYVSRLKRNIAWHPVILDEMTQIDGDQGGAPTEQTDEPRLEETEIHRNPGAGFVPIAPPMVRVDEPHNEIPAPHSLGRIREVATQVWVAQEGCVPLWD